MSNYKIEQKKNDLKKLKELKDLTEILVKDLDGMTKKFEIMKIGAESVSLILTNWKSVINSVSLASLGLSKYTLEDYEKKMPLPEALVRIKLYEEEKLNKDNCGMNINEENQSSSEEKNSEDSKEEI